MKKQIDPSLVKNGDLPRISDRFSEISIGSKGLTTLISRNLVSFRVNLHVHT